MRLIKQLLFTVALLAAPAAGFAADGGEHHGLSTYAPVVLDLGFFKVTNSMIVTWIVALGLIGFAKVATSQMQMVPAGLQNFWEWLVESLASFLEGILGRNLAKQTFWFFATIFIFIIFTNWAGLIPGVGTIGWGVPDASGHLHHIDTPILRGANADLNMTSAMALTFFVCWIWWAIKANGVGGSLAHVFLYRGDAAGIMKFLLIVVFLGVAKGLDISLNLFSVTTLPGVLGIGIDGVTHILHRWWEEGETIELRLILQQIGGVAAERPSDDHRDTRHNAHRRLTRSSGRPGKRAVADRCRPFRVRDDP